MAGQKLGKCVKSFLGSDRSLGAQKPTALQLRSRRSLLLLFRGRAGKGSTVFSALGKRDFQILFPTVREPSSEIVLEVRSVKVEADSVEVVGMVGWQAETSSSPFPHPSSPPCGSIV